MKINSIFLFNIIIILILILPISASTNCEPDQTIFKLFSTSNTHGELFSENNYDEKVCFSEIFGNDFSGSNPHNCLPNNDNVVLWLSDNTNSHASDSESADYNIPICYGDLECRSINSGSCSSDEGLVVSLSSNSNAHIFSGANQDYPYQICCKTETSSLNLALWSDLNDQGIISSNTIGLTDNVKLVINGVDIEGKEIEYKIFEKCDGAFDCLGDLFTGNDIVAQTTTTGEFIWVAGQNIEEDTFSGGEYYFTAQIVGSEPVDSRKNLDGSNNANGILTVSNVADNDPPVALIKFPIDKQIYFFNSPITFEQESYDIDDGFTYVWDFGEGETFEGNSDTLENYIFDYTFDDENNIGQKTILLTVTDDRGESDSTSVTILVINSKFLLAYIDNPINGESFGREVSYDATSSYAVDSETIMTGNENECTKEVTCLGGNCPSQTFGVPTSQSLGCDYIGVGPIQVINAPATPSAVDFSEINFCWFFEEDSTTPFCEFGNGGATFDRTFATPGFHTSTLRVAISE